MRPLKPIKYMLLAFDAYNLEPMQGRTAYRPLASVGVVMMSSVVASHSDDVM